MPPNQPLKVVAETLIISILRQKDSSQHITYAIILEWFGPLIPPMKNLTFSITFFFHFIVTQSTVKCEYRPISFTFYIFFTIIYIIYNTCLFSIFIFYLFSGTSPDSNIRTHTPKYFLLHLRNMCGENQTHTRRF